MCVEMVAVIDMKEAKRSMDMTEKMNPMINPPMLWVMRRSLTSDLYSPGSEPVIVRLDSWRNVEGID